MFAQRTESNSEEDSLAIAKTTIKFYESVFSGLPYLRENWQNGTLRIDTINYMHQLRELGVLSEKFFKSEVDKIHACETASSKIPYTKVRDCGCSVSMLVDGCDFLENFNNWMFTQERYDGFEVADINIEQDLGLGVIKFYYLNGEKRHFDFITARIHLERYENKWLINRIERRSDY
ncbi:MAG: hypothetical protein DCO95_00390 [Roseivirga sp. XM-24bin3]|nr:MAG: hypothetical protein DCO95_00390 [Roseivirga sp. XM-24bin3]